MFCCCMYVMGVRSVAGLVRSVAHWERRSAKAKLYKSRHFSDSAPKTWACAAVGAMRIFRVSIYGVTLRLGWLSVIFSLLGGGADNYLIDSSLP